MLDDTTYEEDDKDEEYLPSESIFTSPRITPDAKRQRTGRRPRQMSARAHLNFGQKKK